jgi:hypothetical protein
VIDVRLELGALGLVVLDLSLLDVLIEARPRAVATGDRGIEVVQRPERVAPVVGPSGEKEGPYDWVPPSYWYDTTRYDPTDSTRTNVGGSWAFDSEASAGHTVPTLVEGMPAHADGPPHARMPDVQAGVVAWAERDRLRRSRRHHHRPPDPDRRPAGRLDDRAEPGR